MSNTVIYKVMIVSLSENVFQNRYVVFLCTSQHFMCQYLIVQSCCNVLTLDKQGSKLQGSGSWWTNCEFQSTLRVTVLFPVSFTHICVSSRPYKHFETIIKYLAIFLLSLL